MVGQLLYSREKGSSPLSSCRYGPLPVIVGVLHEPENLSRRRLIRRLSRLEKAMAAAGVSRVILPEGFVYRSRLTRLHPVQPLPMYRALADVLALGWLDSRRIRPERGRVALWGSRLCPELRQVAERLSSRVRELVIRVPGEGEQFAQALHRTYGLPVLPGDASADIVLAFGPDYPEEENVLLLFGEEPRLGGLKLSCFGFDLPESCSQQILSLLWERGYVDRTALKATIYP